MELAHTDNQIILMGDFNIDMLQESRRRCDWLNFLNSYNIKQNVFEPTRITPTTSTCLDGVYTKVDCQASTNVIHYHVSDHAAQKITFGTDCKKQHVHRRIFSHENREKLKKFLAEQDWTPVYNISREDVDLQFNTFLELYQNNLNRACPLVRITKESKHLKNLTTDPTIKELKNRLDILLLLSQKDSAFKKEYSEIKKQYDSALIQQKKAKFEKIIEDSDNKNKAIWTVINSLKNNAKSNFFHPMIGVQM
ncbi:uncharacterized protein LOC123322295 [Coccinella septempunctata]|uniref:uncharacterized protein LOC123322295 n=1 Tax=Coccinella septempunctata TaxID=41139 RepID=UPI001D0761B9|nr:uncharacterized protein LOC123322295 [Coccinella septempunctata]